jgi:hypothetical protein
MLQGMPWRQGQVMQSWKRMKLSRTIWKLFESKRGAKWGTTIASFRATMPLRPFAGKFRIRQKERKRVTRFSGKNTLLLLPSLVHSLSLKTWPLTTADLCIHTHIPASTFQSSIHNRRLSTSLTRHQRKRQRQSPQAKPHSNQISHLRPTLLLYAI